MENREIYALIHQNYINKLTSQLTDPTSEAKSEGFDRLIKEYYEIPFKELLELKYQIIKDLGTSPAMCSLAMNLLQCCYFLSVIREKKHSLEDIKPIYKVFQLLSGIKNFDVIGCCNRLESAVIPDLLEVNNLKDMIEWISFFDLIEKDFDFNATISNVVIENRCRVIVDEMVCNMDLDAIDLLRDINQLQGKFGLNVQRLLEVSAGFALEKIKILENEEKYWEISEILDTFSTEKISKNTKKKIEFYERKYGKLAPEKKELEAQTEFEVTDFFQVNFGETVFYKTNADRNVGLTIKQGNLNTAKKEKVTIYQYGIYGDFNQKFLLEKDRLKLLSNFPNQMKVYGYFQYALKNIETFFIVTEYEEKSLNDQIKSVKIDLKCLISDLLNLLVKFEKNAISHKNINPSNIFYTNGSYKLTTGTEMIIFQSASFACSFLAPELKSLSNDDDHYHPISFIKADIYSFASTIYYACTQKSYTENSNLNLIKEKWLQDLLGPALSERASSRGSFQEILEKFNKYHP